MVYRLLPCRPGMDPTKNKEAQAGEGYFEDASENIYAPMAWMESRTQKWVRYTVVKSVSGDGGRPENDCRRHV
jgi:hypothetical protein